MNRPLRIGTRSSALALWQANYVADALKTLHPGLVCELVTIKTLGDKILDVPLARIGDRGLFVKEIEEALLQGTIDLAVHSLKDLPTRQPDGLLIAAIGERADPRDCLVLPFGRDAAELPHLACIGTSSLRRKAQLKASQPAWRFDDVRGNVQTRLAKLDAGQFDGIVLAVAGLTRLGLAERISRIIEPRECLPAVGQGALAVECRLADRETQALLHPLDCPLTRACVTAERVLLATLEGGCQVPIGALARIEAGMLTLHAMVASLDGGVLLLEQHAGPQSEPAALGELVAEALLARGAATILEGARL